MHQVNTSTSVGSTVDGADASYSNTIGELKMNRALGIALLAVFSAATPGWSQASPEVAAFLLRSMEAQAANGAATVEHSWIQSTEIVLDGDSKGTMFHLVRFDLDRQPQRTTLRRTNGVAIGYPEFTGQRLIGHRGWHGYEHPAA